MTREQKNTALKKLNERAVDMARRFGTNSSIYRDYINSLTMIVGVDNMHTPKKQKRGKGQKQTAASMGVPQASRSGAVLDKISDEDIEAMLSHKTAGQIVKAAKEEAKRESEETGEPVTAEEVIDAQEYVTTVMNEDGEEFYNAVSKYWEMMGGAGSGAPKPSYRMLKYIIEQEKAAYEAYKQRDLSEYNNIENKLTKRLTDLRDNTTVSRYFT